MSVLSVWYVDDDGDGDGGVGAVSIDRVDQLLNGNRSYSKTDFVFVAILMMLFQQLSGIIYHVTTP